MTTTLVGATSPGDGRPDPLTEYKIQQLYKRPPMINDPLPIAPVDQLPDAPTPIEGWFRDAAREAWPEILFNQLVPECPIWTSEGTYRVDFALVFDYGNGNICRIGIECDGFAFHSDAKALARDRRRQLTLELLGWTIIRFSGSELFWDAPGCANRALERVQQRIRETAQMFIVGG
jgi:hypothetical protein